MSKGPEFRESHRRRHFDEDMPVDVENVLDVSAILEIKEFEVFSLAHKWWFAKEAPDRVLEPYFAAYMFKATIPYWVRQFTREMLRRKDEGTLNPADFGIVPETITPTRRDRGLGIILLVLGALIAVYLVAFTATRIATIFGSCLLPPCY